MNNWVKLLARISSIIPLLIVGVEQVHQDLKGPDKKAAVMEAIGLGQDVASALIPEQRTNAAAAAQFASTLIDTTVKTMNEFGVLKKQIQGTTGSNAPALK